MKISFFKSVPLALKVMVKESVLLRGSKDFVSSWYSTKPSKLKDTSNCSSSGSVEVKVISKG